MGKYVLNKNSEYAKNRTKFSFLRILFSQIFIFVLLLILEIFLIINFYDFFKATKLTLIVNILNIFSILYIINSKRIRNAYKIAWMVVFVILPGLGVFFYVALKIMDQFNLGNKKLRDICIKSYKYYNTDYNDNIRKKAHEMIMHDNSSNYYIEEQLINEYSFFNYFDNFARFPAYRNSSTKYFSNGKDYFEDLLENLSNAKKFIFIETFILSDGIVWQVILNILKQKVNEGVEVRLIYDGLNAVSSFTKKYCKVLEGFGIKAKVFKPIAPVLSNTQNHRDHRKIIIIDNEIAYTGGINIADEYANLYERFGYWKDSGIRVIGSAVESFTIMYLQIWELDKKSNIFEIEKYLYNYDKKIVDDNDYSFIVPYTDYPSLTENISLQIFKNMFNTAIKYLYIMTPYLIIDEDILDTLESAAKKGVDVRIILPHIPDKKYVFYLNRSLYKALTMTGVRVYEYLPGFVHAKVYLQDDVRAVVGTANLDFRSLFLHYENGVYMFAENQTLKDIKDDFDKVLSECREMTLAEINKIPVIYRILGPILKVFAPMM